MTKISIDNKEYELEALSDDAKGQLASIQFVDSELRKLQAQAAVLQTARVAYSRALQEALAGVGVSAPTEAVATSPGSPETLQFPSENVNTGGWKSMFKK